VHRIRNASASLTGFFRGFQSTSRGNPLAQKIVKAGIDQGHGASISFYAPDNCKLTWTTFSVKCDLCSRAILERHTDASQL